MRLKVYKDSAGIETIGIGRNLRDKGISKEEAMVLLENDLGSHWDELVEKLPWVGDLDQVRQRVLLNMAFNLGVYGLLNFKNTLAMIKDGRYDDASQNMLESRWAKQVGTRAIELSTSMRTGRD